MKKIFLIVISFILSINVLNASCNSVNDDVKKINISLEETTDTVKGYINEGNALKEVNTILNNLNVVVENLTNYMYVIVKNDYNSEIKTYYNDSFSNGRLNIVTASINEEINYYISIYSSNDCGNSLLKDYSIKTKVYNRNHELGVCKESKFEIEICKKFLDEEKIINNTTEFVNEVKNQIEIAQKKEDSKLINIIINFCKTYYLYILIPFVVVAIAYIVLIIVNKRRIKNALK